MDAAAELGRNPVSTIFSLSMEMSRLTRDGTAEPVSQTKFSGTHGDRGTFIFPVQLTTSRIGNLTRLIHTLLYVMTIHTYIHTDDKDVFFSCPVRILISCGCILFLLLLVFLFPIVYISCVPSWR